MLLHRVQNMAFQSRNPVLTFNTTHDKLLFLFAFSALVRFQIMANGHLQIRGIKKTDEGMYHCEARVAARGEIDFKKIKVIVNGKLAPRARGRPCCSTRSRCSVYSRDDPEIHDGVLL